METRIEELRRLRAELAELDAAAQALPPEVIAEKDCNCHLIEGRQGA